MSPHSNAKVTFHCKLTGTEPTLHTTDPSSDAASLLGAADSCELMTQSVLCTADPSSDTASLLGAAGSCEPLTQSELHVTNISDNMASLLGQERHLL